MSPIESSRPLEGSSRSGSPDLTREIAFRRGSESRESLGHAAEELSTSQVFNYDKELEEKMKLLMC
jgi:hypothetical protein